MKKNKGFTLVELLATITILGIIAALAFPLISNINYKNTMKKYDLYKNTLLSASKLYIDSYEEDLFGHKTSGCSIITYDDLKKQDLIKDIDINNTTCNSENTFVQVNKWKKQYYYKISLGCGENKNKKLLEEELNYKTDIIDKTLCVGNTNVSDIVISADKDTTEEENRKRKETKITLSSYTGIAPNAIIYYSFSKTMNYDEITDFTQLPITIPSEEIQNKDIINSTPVEISSSPIRTEENGNGEYYLIIKVDYLEDLEGVKWHNQADNTDYLYLGSYYIDNTKPDFKDSMIVSNLSDYNGIKPYLNLKVEDNNTPQERLRMCVSLENDNCPKDAKDFNNENIYKKYQNKYPITFKVAKLDGTKHKIYVTVIDEAKNYETKVFDYQFAFSYTITYKTNGGTACNPSKKTITYNEGETPKWGELCIPSKETMTFVEWNTSQLGDGITITEDTIADKSLVVYAIYKGHTCRIIYDTNEGEFLTNNNKLEDSCEYIDEDSICNDKLKSTDTFFNARKEGYHLDDNREWISNNNEVFSDSKKYRVTEICKNIAIGDETILLKANWKKD